MLRSLSVFLLTCSLPVQVYAATLPTLDMSNYTLDKGQDFTTTSSFDTSVWTNVFATDTWFSDTAAEGLWLGSDVDDSPSWSQNGFMQTPNSCRKAGFGYGVFQWVGKVGQQDQAPGANMVMWRADNDWIDPKLVNADGSGYLTEIDILEDWDYNNYGTSTLHRYGTAADPNHADYYTLATGSTTVGLNGVANAGGTSINITTKHTYDVVWEAGMMELFVDGSPLWKYTGEVVPKDGAHGGCNETLGAQVFPNGATQTLPQDLLILFNMYHYNDNNALTISRVTANTLAGTFVIQGTLAGVTEDIAWESDGVYQGVLMAHSPTGVWTKLENIPTGTVSGSHVITVYEVANPTITASYTVTY